MANLCESQTMKLLRAWLHETIKSVAGSSTMSNVFVRNGGGPASCSPTIGCGERAGDELLPPMSSTFTFTPSMAFLLRIAFFLFLFFLSFGSNLFQWDQRLGLSELSFRIWISEVGFGFSEMGLLELLVRRRFHMKDRIFRTGQLKEKDSTKWVLNLLKWVCRI